MKSTNKKPKARVQVSFNTGTRVHKSKKAYKRENRVRKEDHLG